MLYSDYSTYTWEDTLRYWFHPSVVTMLFFGFAAGLPFLLVFSTLSLWLREAGVDRSSVTFFSWAALGYSFKFVWAPLVDRLSLPLLTYWLGRRRAWLLLAQVAIIVAILLMAITDPSQAGGITRMAIGAILLGFSAATQDIVIDAYRIESAPLDLQAMLSSSYIAGYRIGMLVAGAGALLLAEALGTHTNAYQYRAWMLTYMAMAMAMLIGVITTLLAEEPIEGIYSNTDRPLKDYIGFLAVFLVVSSVFVIGFWWSGLEVARFHAFLQPTAIVAPLFSFSEEIIRFGFASFIAWNAAVLLVALGIIQWVTLDEAYIAPIREFFQRYGTNTAWLLLTIIGVYRVFDILLGVIANVFYQDLGFSKSEIAGIVNTYGLLMTLMGSFLGGALVLRYGVINILFAGAWFSIAAHLLFLLLARVGHDVPMLYFVISAENLSAGLASAAFIAFLSSLTNAYFTAMQYAIFSSLMTLLPKLLGGYSGTLVEIIGYQGFFMFTTLLGLPVLLLIRRVQWSLNYV